MAPILFHGFSHPGFPVICVESRQAYRALKSLETHVKSLQTHALRSLIVARKKLVASGRLHWRHLETQGRTGANACTRPPMSC
jgi:hypothetical protein